MKMTGRLLKTLGITLMLLASFAALATVVLAQANSITVNLQAQNNSGQTGTATLTDLGNGKTRVDIVVTGAPAGVPEPAHIHDGACPNPGKVVYPLNNVVDGKSTTEVNASLTDLTSGKYAINGHKSAQEISVYVFCGDITAAGTTVTGTVTATEAATPAAGTTMTATTEATTAATTPEAGTTETSTTEATVSAGTTATPEVGTTATTEATATEGATPEATVTSPTLEATSTTGGATAGETTTPAPGETPSTLPATGADSPTNWIIPLFLIGLGILVTGLYVSRVSKS